MSYSDHSGNRYRFWQAAGDDVARFAYVPVTPERSSSGTYSGGDPREGTLDPAQAEALFAWIRDLEADSESHSTSRAMGTGWFRVREGDCAERRFILRAGERRQAFDAFVEPFRKP